MSTIWPDDVDGDVLRTIEAAGFDFSKPTSIDFNVDFDTWPPSTDAVDILTRQFPDLQIHEPDSKSDGDITFQVYALLTYELVMQIQGEVSELMAPFGGRCESWGVMGESPVHATAPAH